jgi:predicted DNA-binding protein (MmcQ/YjbR family)
MKRYGPPCRRAQNASAAPRIFVRHPKKTFATISERNGQRGPVAALIRMPRYITTRWDPSYKNGSHLAAGWNDHPQTRPAGKMSRAKWVLAPVRTAFAEGCCWALLNRAHATDLQSSAFSTFESIEIACRTFGLDSKQSHFGGTRRTQHKRSERYARRLWFIHDEHLSANFRKIASHAELACLDLRWRMMSATIQVVAVVPAAC